ncbi:MAG: dockerin type I domain-containing protein, partial [Rubripirellula sp.]
PSPTTGVLDSSPGNRSTLNIEVDFGEPVTGFDASDLTLTSGVVDSVSDRGEGRFIVSVSDLPEGDFMLGLAAGAASDEAGNQSLSAVDLTQTIILPNTDTIILEGDGNTFVFTESGSQLDGVQLIDIRGTGDNTLMLHVGRIRELFQDGSITVLSDVGDQVVFDDGWEFVEAILSDGQLVRRFEQQGAAINLTGPNDFTNPISEFDVNASGDVSALDALVIINELAGRQFSDGGTSPEGGVRDPDAIDLNGFRFYDVTRDLRITALDALRVINQLARQPAANERIEGESAASLIGEASDRNEHRLSIDVDAEIEFQKPMFPMKTGNSETKSVEQRRLEVEAPERSESESMMSADSVDYVLRLLH